MNERQIDFFFTVAEEKNFGRASLRLPLSSSALARQIHSLEQEVGAELFTRTSAGVELTQSGEVWLRHMRQLKVMLAQAGNDVHRVANRSSLRLDIGVMATNSVFGGLDRVLKHFSARCPDVEVAVHDLPTRRQQIEALRQGRIQAAFNIYMPAMPGLCVEEVARENVWVVLSPTHPLASRQAVHLTELRGCPMIGTREMRDDPPEIAKVYRHHAFEPRIEHRTSEIYSFLGMTACSLGVILLPPSIQALRFPGVVFRPLLADLEIPFRFDCAYLEDQRSPLLDALLETVRAHRVACY